MTGVLSDFMLRSYTENGVIRSAVPVRTGQIQPASLDLRLGGVAYRIRAGFMPGQGRSVQDRMESLKMHTVDLQGTGGVLEKGAVYLIPLQESLTLPEGVCGSASPKSSTGRLDILTRLLTDGGMQFDRIPAGYKGPLYVEVTPLTFSVIAREGDTLTQLRLRQGDPSVADAELHVLHAQAPLVFTAEGTPMEAACGNGLWLSVDLKGEGVGLGNATGMEKSCNGRPIVAYRARRHAPLLDLSRIGHYSVEDFWEPLYPAADGSLILEPESFYIMASRERVTVPADYSAEMMAYETTAGELRVHYAGFFDPGWGVAQGELSGTPAVLEIRSHDVPFVLEHGQRICRLMYEKMAERPSVLYGTEIGSNYARQGLALAKQFSRTAA